MGGLGYFPTYTLGNLYAAQFMDAGRGETAGAGGRLRRGEFGRLKGWLNEKVHRPGRSYRSSELCRRVTGEGLRHGPLMAYLRKSTAGCTACDGIAVRTDVRGAGPRRFGPQVELFGRRG